MSDLKVRPPLPSGRFWRKTIRDTRSAVDVDGFLRFCWLAGMIRLGIGGESAAANVGAVIANGVGDNFGYVCVLAGELWRLTECEAEEIVDDQDLAIAVRACSDADCRDAQLAGDTRGKISRHGFEHDGECACGFDSAGVPHELFRGVGGLALDPKATQRIQRLRRESNVTHHWNFGF